MARILFLILLATCGFHGTSLIADEPQGDLHWAFRNLIRPAQPEVQAKGKIRTPIDSFLLKKLESNGLTFSAPAERVTLLRRVFLDTIGLPPSIGQADDFMVDVRPDAVERTIDALLASPRFGERWARHWLDVVGYMDTVGFDQDAALVIVPKGKWKYRHYVIDAFNKDKTYDQFVKEQLAGDEISGWRNAEVYNDDIREKLIATGFLRTAADFTHEPESFIELNMFEVLHDTMEIVNTSLFGLTMNCSRCHDHKFDPLSQADYYRMMACFTPAYNPQKWIAVYPWNDKIKERGMLDISEKELAEYQAHNMRVDNEVARIDREVDGLRQALREKLLAEKRVMRSRAPQADEQVSALQPVVQGLSLWLRADQDVFVDSAGKTVAQPGDSVALWKDQLAGENSAANDAGQAKASERPILVEGFSGSHSRAIRFDRSQQNHLRASDHPTLRTDGTGLTIFVTYKLNEVATSDVQLVTKYAEDGTSHGNWGVDLFHSAGKDPNRPRLYFGNPKKTNEYGGGVATTRGLSDQFPHQLTFVYDEGKTAIRFGGKDEPLEHAGTGPPSPAFNSKDAVDLIVGARTGADGQGNAFFPGDIAEILVYRRALSADELTTTEQYLAAKYGPSIEISEEALKTALASDQGVSKLREEKKNWEDSRKTWGMIQALYDVGEPPETHFLEGGSYLSPGEAIEPGFIEVLNENREISFRQDSLTSGRRTALANWATDATGPSGALLARVMTNRVWQHLFGQGIVSTAENFGIAGEAPSHLQLLEWLSNDFASSGWQIKRLIRSLLSSAAYQQQSELTATQQNAGSAIPQAKDHLLWRMRLRRLDAEVIRDSILAVTDSLDRTMGGPPVHLSAQPNGMVVVDASKLARPSEKWRRSIYLVHRRNYNLSMLATFDQPLIATTCSRRRPSAIVSQSLTMLNDKFLFEHARRLAERTIRLAGDAQEAQITTAFQLALVRLPNTSEVAWCSETYSQQVAAFQANGKPSEEAKLDALTQICLTILNTSEFLYAE